MKPEHLQLLLTREMPFGKYKGRVIADLGTVNSSRGPGWSFDGAYYAYLVPAGCANAQQ